MISTKLTVSTIVLAIVAITDIMIAGQTRLELPLIEMQQRLFPGATFSTKSGDPPLFKAFVTDPGSGAQRLLGIAFWTTELAPLERGYDGPIKMLVGVDVRGVLTGVVVVDHHEPYGYFS